jgi:hypothetical protein
VFYALERFLDPATRDVLQAWIEKDIYVWRIKAMLGYPPIWRLKMLAGPRSAVCRTSLRENVNPVAQPIRYQRTPHKGPHRALG